MKNVTVIIPTLNEEDNILTLVNLVKRLDREIDILIVDDGSKDNTRQIAERINKKIKNVRLVDRAKKKIKGLSASVIDGAKLVKTKYIIVMDADLQHPPNKISEIVKKLKKDYDIVIATRRKITELSLCRRIISKTANILGGLRLLLKGYSVSDSMSGFFGIKTRLLKEILLKHENKFEKQGYKILFDILKYAPFNTKICCIYYKFRARVHGLSKIGKKQIIYFVKALFK